MIRDVKAPLAQMIELGTIETQEEWDAAVARLSGATDRIRNNIGLALSYVEGECQTVPQPSEAATELALTATPETFPRDSYGLARWIDRAFAQAKGRAA